MERRHVVVMLCGLSSFVCYADRVNISVAILHMGIENPAKGWVLASFFYGYFTTQILGGWLSTRYGGRVVLNVAVMWWSVFTCLTPWAAWQGLGTLLFCRVLMGAGEGLAFPAIYDILSQWAPVTERARSFAVVQLGVKAGTMLALAVCPTIISWIGWPAVFYAFGAMGFAWNLLWMALADKKPPVDYHLAEKEEEAAADRTTMVQKSNSKVHELTPQLAWKFVCAPPVWALVAGHAAYAWAHYLLLSWLPTYLHEVHGISKDSMGISAVPFAAMSLGIVGWSSLADGWASMVSLTTVRKGMTTLGLGGAAMSMMLLTQAPNAMYAVAVTSLALGVQAAAGSGVVINHVDLAPRHSAVLLSMSNSFATMSGMVAIPLASAIMATPGGSWNHVFVLAAAVLSTGLLVYRRFASAEPLNLGSL